MMHGWEDDVVKEKAQHDLLVQLIDEVDLLRIIEKKSNWHLDGFKEARQRIKQLLEGKLEDVIRRLGGKGSNETERSTGVSDG
jgi:hypothetical protein